MGDPDTATYAKLSNKPLRLMCADASHCKVAANVTYYAKNYTLTGDHMVKACFWQLTNGDVANAVDLCLPTMLEAKVPYIVQPIEAEVLPNDPDQCGFYAMPFSFVRH